MCVCYHNDAASCEVRLGEDWRVRLDDALMQEVEIADPLGAQASLF